MTLAQVWQAFCSKLGIPFKSDLATHHTTRSGYDLIDSIGGLNAKILPSCAIFNGVDQYVYGGQSPYITGSKALEIKCNFRATGLAATSLYIMNCGAHGVAFAGFCLRISPSGDLIFATAKGDSSAIGNQTIANISLNTDYTLTLNWTGVTGGVVSWNLNGTTGSGTTTKGWVGLSTEPLVIAARQSAGTPPTTVTQFFKGLIGYFKVEDEVINYELNLTGIGKYAYSNDYAIEYRNGATVSSSTLGGSSTYSVLGTLNLLDNGYKIYKKTDEPDEYIPIGGSLSKLDGYTLFTTRDANLTGINKAPCKIDFNPTNAVEATLAIFDRSNTTICNDFARGVMYEVTQPSRWHVDEITDPRIYFDYFNAGYIGKLYGKIETETIEEEIYIKNYTQQLNYTTDKLGADQYKIMTYCGANVFAL